MAEAALGRVQAPALLSSAVAGTENVGAGTSTPTSLTPSVPLTKLLGGRGLTTALLLLALTATGATPLRRAATSSTAATAASATSAASGCSTPMTRDVDARGMAAGATSRHAPGRPVFFPWAHHSAAPLEAPSYPRATPPASRAALVRPSS
ncbi:unnamed protein product [Closterium sp. NIES-53]